MTFKLKKNDNALDFEVNAIINMVDIKKIKLSDYKGRKIVLYFYPKDLTPGCNLEAENFRDNFKIFQENNIIIIGVSIDSIKRHIQFADKKSLPFILVSDEDKKVVNDYGVWQLKKFMGREYMGIVRTTFLIDENFKIHEIITKVKVKDHSSQIFDSFGIN